MRIHHAHTALWQFVENDRPFEKAGQNHQAVGQRCFALSGDERVDDVPAEKMKVDARGKRISVNAAFKRSNGFFRRQCRNRDFVFAGQFSENVQIGFELDAGDGSG